MANRFKLENGVLTLVNENNEVVYESKPGSIKKSFLDKTADFIRDLPEIPTPSFLKLSPEPGSSSTESEDQPNKKEEANTTEVSITETNADVTTVAVTSEAAKPVTKENKVDNPASVPPIETTPTEVTAPESSSTEPTPVIESSTQKSNDAIIVEQSEENSERTKVPTVAEVVIEAKVG